MEYQMQVPTPAPSRPPLGKMALALILGLAAGPVLADDEDDDDRGGSLYSGPCAYLPASRATEFHGNPANNDLALAMAGNQWVVFDEVMRAFNVATGRGDGMEPVHHDNTFVDANGDTVDYWTRAMFQAKERKYFIELIPPGQEVKQILGGCMILGNEKETNFLPLTIQTRFDVFASTNYTLMDRLGAAGFISKAVPYTKNQLTLMVDEGNSKGVGVGGSELAVVYSAVEALLDDCDHDASGCITGADPGIRVSQVDHINEGVHRGINKMYMAMDEYVRLNGSPAQVAALDVALAAVATPQPGSPAATRSGISTNFELASNPSCHYMGHAGIADGTLRLCEFAVLNKSNTHETRVHHVETPDRIRQGLSDVGPVWVSELKFALNHGGGVSGAVIPDSVNKPVVYSITILEKTVENKKMALKFVNFIRSPAGQAIYEAGGFNHMCTGPSDPTGCMVDDFAGGRTYPDNRPRVNPKRW